MRPALIVLVLAAGSALLVAPVPDYDPWSWLVWGREVTRGELSTAEGPAFKPLPVAVCALLTPLGAAAPWAWVILVRAAALVATWLAYRAGSALAGGSRAAGVLAAGGVLLCGAFPALAATGAETPLLLALALAGAEAWRRDRAGAALACAVGCALLRVEAWPFALGFGFWLWRTSRVDRRRLIALAVAVPAAWFVPEYLGSGDLLRSGERARIPNPGQPALAEHPALESLRAAAALPLWPLLAGAAYALVRGPVVLRGVVAAGLTWVALVAVMAQAGFSGEPRYALPGAAVVSLAGAAGLVLAARRLPGPAVALVVALAAVVSLPRLDAVASLPDRQDHRWQLASRLPDAITAAGGREAVLACGTPYVGRLRGPLLAHRLDVAKHRVQPDAAPASPGVAFVSRLEPGSEALPEVPPGWRHVGTAGPWSVHAACGVRVP